MEDPQEPTSEDAEPLQVGWKTLPLLVREEPPESREGQALLYATENGIFAMMPSGESIVLGLTRYGDQRT